ncbi:TrbI/VirB10 family protein [Sphingomonas sp. GB1N7]|uniref:TrbI/VirB10 family protein n=1 Tax=Parasphingomonas caseinilytica TaxID=3096158 RepID=UPI002FCB133D
MTEPAAEDALPPPPDLQLRGDPPRVMRLSRKALSILGLIASTAVGGALIYALQPVTKQAPSELYKTESRSTADSLASAPKDYGQIPKLGPPLPGDLGRPILSAQQRGVGVQAPPMGATGPGSRSTGANASQAARQRVGQERDAARTSKLFLGSSAGSESVGAVGSAAPNSLSLVAGLPGQAAATATASGDDEQGHKRAFLGAEVDRRTGSVQRLEPLSSPYTLQAGSVISAALVTGIRSDLPGQITAQVTANVYDSPTGRLLLIPQGAKLVGEYDSQVSFGQNRVLLAWTRLILPDGSSVVLDRQPGADVSGYAGLQDSTNYHLGGIAKAALLSTILGVGAQAGGSSDSDLVRAVRQGTSDTVSQTGQQIVRRQLNIQPTLTIRPGYPVRVIVTHDLVLAPPHTGEK